MTSREFHDRLLTRGRKAGLSVPAHLVAPLETYYRLLARWNDKINLTALPLRELTDRTVDRLLIEPLAATHLIPDTTQIWFDLGSGGGSPALPLKLARPSLHLTMVEATSRKASFLREAVRTLALKGVDVDNARFEGLLERPELQQSIGLITVRAVKVDKTLVHAACSLLSVGGLLLLFSSEAPVHLGQFHRFTLVQTAKLSAEGSSAVVVLRREP